MEIPLQQNVKQSKLLVKQRNQICVAAWYFKLLLTIYYLLRTALITG